jgi:adhesin/invasin
MPRAALAESLVVQVADPAGAGIPGVVVTWSVAGGGSASPVTSTTDAAGRAATQRVLGEGVGAYGTTATASVTQGSPVLFLATAASSEPDPDKSKLQISPSTLQASAGGSAATVTITIRDRHGDPVPNVLVTLSATGSANTLTQPAAPTDARGVTTGHFSSTAIGVHVISATAAGISIDQTAKVTVVASPASPATTVATVDPRATFVASEVALTIDAYDAFGNPIHRSGEPITATAVFDGDPRAIPIAYDSDAERYVGSFRPWSLGTFTVEIAVDGTPIAGSPFQTVMQAF